MCKLYSQERMNTFFPVQQQSQFPKDKIKRQQEVKSDQTWLLPCILPGVCLKCIQTWCGSGYIHIARGGTEPNMDWTDLPAFDLQSLSESHWRAMAIFASSDLNSTLLLQICGSTSLHFKNFNASYLRWYDTLANVLITVLSNQLILVATLATAVFLLKQCVFKPIPFLP